jgi:hypothetical protein
MALIENNCEGGTDGTPVTVGNSGGASGTAFTTVSNGGGTINYSAAAAQHGSLGIRMTGSGTAAYLVDFDDPTPAASFALRFQFNFPTLPSGATQAGFPLGIRSSTAGAIGGINMDTTGHIQMFIVSGGSFSTGALAINTNYRAEVVGTGFNSAATTCTMNVYQGDTATLAATCTVSGVTTTALFNRARIGKQSTGSVPGIDIDDVAMNVGSSTQIGPVAFLTPGWSGGWDLRIG